MTNWKKTIWQVPLFCLCAGWINFRAAILLMPLALHRLPDGSLTPDDTRVLLIWGVLFLANAAVGWSLFRRRTRRELFWSAAVLTVYGLILLAVQYAFQLTTGPAALRLYLLNRPFEAFTFLTQLLTKLCYRLTGSLWLPSVLAAFLPFLFVLCGRPEEPPAESTLHLQNQNIS